MKRAQRKVKVTTARSGVFPTKERHRRNGGLIAEFVLKDENSHVTTKRYRAVWECQLDVHKDEGRINSLEHKAGLKFREAYFRAVQSRTAARHRYPQTGPSASPTVSERLVKEARKTLPPYNRGVVIDICGHDHPAADVRRLHALRKGLGQLALLWNLAALETTGH